MKTGITHFLLWGILLLTVASSVEGRVSRAHTNEGLCQGGVGGTSPQKSSKFTLSLMANGTTKDGFPFSQNTFERLPGEKVYVLMIHFRSSEAVKKQFAATLRDATKIIEQKKVTKNGVTEERAVITLSMKDARALTMIVSTADTVLREVQSFSEEAALEFEEQAEANQVDAKH